MVIPFADCINHHNVDSTYELVHRKYHLAQSNFDPNRGPKEYYTQSKMGMDYSDFFEDNADYLREKARKNQWHGRTLYHYKQALKRHETL